MAGTEPFDPMPGSVHSEMIRCGKSNCRCATVADFATVADECNLHGPYHFRYFIDNGKTRKVYVRKRDVAATIDACNRFRLAAKEISEAKKCLKNLKRLRNSLNRDRKQ